MLEFFFYINFKSFKNLSIYQDDLRSFLMVFILKSVNPVKTPFLRKVYLMLPLKIIIMISSETDKICTKKFRNMHEDTFARGVTFSAFAGE